MHKRTKTPNDIRCSGRVETLSAHVASIVVIMYKLQIMDVTFMEKDGILVLTTKTYLFNI